MDLSGYFLLVKSFTDLFLFTIASFLNLPALSSNFLALLSSLFADLSFISIDFANALADLLKSFSLLNLDAFFAKCAAFKSEITPSSKSPNKSGISLAILLSISSGSNE